MSTAKLQAASTPRDSRWLHRVAVAGLLLVSAGLAISSLVGDSITFDETSKLTSGVSYLRTGDFRLAPDHPPLAKMWTALPLLLMEHHWPDPQAPGWPEGNVWPIGRAWLSELNDGQRLVIAGRLMMVLLLVATCLAIYAMARSLFGPGGGLLALLLATLSPTLLAHGRLVTTDLPATLCMTLTLLSFARLMQGVTWARLLAASLAVSAFSVVKFSWPLVLPAIVVMAVVAVLRREPMDCRAIPFAASLRFASRPARVAAVAGIAVFMIVIGWLSIWTCYGWRYSSLPEAQRDSVALPVPAAGDRPPPTTIAAAWEAILQDDAGQPASGAVPGFVRWARHHCLLPEAYLYGLAYTLRTTGGSPAYLMGEVSTRGWLSYFPIAFVIKTPVPTMLLLVGGLAAMARGRAERRRNVVLLAGLVCFTLVYALFVITSGLNIGHRHILPIYPAVMVFAGASAGWCQARAGRWLIGLAIGWLAAGNLLIHPHYLCYFNELIGGPGRGHRYLADSNIDWGQDLKRLARYAQQHPDERIKLAYFGSVDPKGYGIACEMLPSFFPVAESARLTAGTYVISVTQLLGVYEPLINGAFWTPANLRRYRQLQEMVSGPAGETSAQARAEFEALRRRRLINQLQRRPPDERISYSLFVYRLTQAEVDAVTAP